MAKYVLYFFDFSFPPPIFTELRNFEDRPMIESFSRTSFFVKNVHLIEIFIISKARVILRENKLLRISRGGELLF